MTIQRIGVLTGGGDAPGLNPAIKAVVYKAAEQGIAVIGLFDGWSGLLDGPGGQKETWQLDEATVRTWDRDGGTHLGSSRTNPWRSKLPDGTLGDRSAEVIANVKALGLDALIPIGGEDTLGVAARLAAEGVHVVGIPKTIDKDLGGTDYTLGFDTSMRTCAEVIERSRTPAGSHHWVQVVEVMGRHAGHLALWSGVAGGAQMILIPEVPFDPERVLRLLEDRLSVGLYDRRQPRYAVVVVAEGATPSGGAEVTVDGQRDAFGHVRLGGVGAWLAEHIRSHSKFDARAVALGHPQRGGPPSPVDRIMGLLFGTAAVEAVVRGEWGRMVSAKGVAPACELSLVPLAEAVKALNLVDVKRHYDADRYFVARRVFG